MFKENRQLIWLHKDGITTRVGFGAEIGEFQVETAFVLSIEKGTRHLAGIVCRSPQTLQYFWLPSFAVSWTEAPLNVDQLKRFFEKRRYKVALVPKERKSPSVSITALSEAVREFKKLTVNQEFVARIEEQTRIDEDGKTHYLVASYTSNFIMDCEVYFDEGHKAFTEKSLIPVEVIRTVFEKNNQVLVVPVGMRRYQLDLPLWMTTQQMIRTDEPRDIVAQYRQWRAEGLYRSLASDVAYTRNLSREPDEQINHWLCAAYDAGPKPAENSISQAQLRVALEWVNRFSRRPEIFVPYAIMSTVLLHHFYVKSLQNRALLANTLDMTIRDVEDMESQWSLDACRMAQELGRRALRSIHVETLASKWLSSNNNLLDNRSRAGALWKRLNDIGSNMGSSITISFLQTIKQFSYAVELRNLSRSLDMYLIADGLRAAIGDLDSVERLMAEAQVTHKLLTIYRTLPYMPTQYQAQLHSAHITLLQDTLEIIDTQGLDITLLMPVPILGEAVSSSTGDDD